MSIVLSVVPRLKYLHWLKASILLLVCFGLAFAQNTQFKVGGLKLPILAPGAELRILWQNTQTTVVKLPISAEMRINLIQTNTAIPLPNNSDWLDLLGLQNCALSPTVSPTGARVAGTDLFLYSSDQKPYAMFQVLGLERGYATRSVLVYAEKATEITAKGQCSVYKLGQVQLSLQLRPGWNWITYLSQTTQVNNGRENQINTIARVSPFPVGNFQLAPLRENNP